MVVDREASRGGRHHEQAFAREAVAQKNLQPLTEESDTAAQASGAFTHQRVDAVFVEHYHPRVNPGLSKSLHESVCDDRGASEEVAVAYNSYFNRFRFDWHLLISLFYGTRVYDFNILKLETRFKVAGKFLPLLPVHGGGETYQSHVDSVKFGGILN